ncbi:hypothetical protein [Methylobacterium sp. ID0610]|uniref:hypothetical protein n=1 Tax=Methylobacterium carpenticola TaxID=3344827 RepID=UPI00367E974A
MRILTLSLAAATLAGALSLSTAPASAAVTGPTAVSQNGGMIEQTRMTHREMRRHRTMHGRGVSRRMMQQDINARNPSRPGYQQQKGNTSGGPAY